MSQKESDVNIDLIDLHSCHFQTGRRNVYYNRLFSNALLSWEIDYSLYANVQLC